MVQVSFIFTALLAVLILTKSGCQSESSDLNATFPGDGELWMFPLGCTGLGVYMPACREFLG